MYLVEDRIDGVAQQGAQLAQVGQRGGAHEGVGVAGATQKRIQQRPLVVRRQRPQLTHNLPAQNQTCSSTELAST